MSEAMVDEEVENILAEIRDRVRGRELPPALSNFEQENGVEKPSFASLASRNAVDTSAVDAMARIGSSLAVTSRSWDRLPPLVSNRSGSLALIELWVKRQIKRATHWFTWEQINFNAAVHQALSAYQQALRAETEAQRTMIENALQAQVEAQRKDMDARLLAMTHEMQRLVEYLQEEQRVCFKQLSLEATEASVREDRARRQTEKVIEEFRARLDQGKQ